MYICYTDGSLQCQNQEENRGGWASIILNEDGTIHKKLYQGVLCTTNNRMEITAVLETLKYFKTPQKLKIYSDSQYVVNTINCGWAKHWFERQDYSKKNLDLWFQVLDLLEFHDVTMKWVKGHENSEMNNLADMLCVHAAQCLNLPKDEVGTVNF